MTEKPETYRGFYPSDSAELDRQTYITIVLSLLVGAVVALAILVNARLFA